MDNIGTLLLGMLLGFILCSFIIAEDENLTHVKSSQQGWSYIEYNGAYYKLQRIEIQGIPIEKENE